MSSSIFSPRYMSGGLTGIQQHITDHLHTVLLACKRVVQKEGIIPRGIYIPYYTLLIFYFLTFSSKQALPIFLRQWRLILFYVWSAIHAMNNHQFTCNSFYMGQAISHKIRVSTSYICCSMLKLISYVTQRGKIKHFKMMFKENDEFLSIFMTCSIGRAQFKCFCCNIYCTLQV